MIICITGQMSAGKNYVSSIFEKNGFASVDFDQLVHEAIDKSEEKIIETFRSEAEKAGISLVNENGKLDRRAIGRLVFPRPDLLKKQEQIVYPAVNELAEKFVESHKSQNIIFNATVLYKVPELLNRCEKIIYVKAPFFTRLKRARNRDHLKISLILQRFKSQKNLFSKYKKTGIPVITLKNSGSVKKLEKSISKIIGELKSVSR